MFQIADDVSEEVQCACGCTVFREPIRKGDRAGQWRLVTIDGTMHHCNGVPFKRGEWTDDERAFVQSQYGPMTVGQIALALNRSAGSVKDLISAINRQRRRRK